MKANPVTPPPHPSPFAWRLRSPNGEGAGGAAAPKVAQPLRDWSQLCGSTHLSSPSGNSSDSFSLGASVAPRSERARARGWFPFRIRQGVRSRGSVLECGGKRSATPLSVADALLFPRTLRPARAASQPPHSITLRAFVDIAAVEIRDDFGNRATQRVAPLSSFT